MTLHSKCLLNKDDIYQVNNIKYDQTSDKYIITIDNPPPTCPEGKFKELIAVKLEPTSESPILSFNFEKNKPELTIPNQGFIEIINAPVQHYILWIVAALIIGGFFSFFIRILMQKIDDNLIEDKVNKNAPRNFENIEAIFTKDAGGLLKKDGAIKIIGEMIPIPEPDFGKNKYTIEEPIYCGSIKCNPNSWSKCEHKHKTITRQNNVFCLDCFDLLQQIGSKPHDPEICYHEIVKKNENKTVTCVECGIILEVVYQ